MDINAQLNELNEYVDFGKEKFEDYDPSKQEIQKVIHQGKRFVREWDSEHGTNYEEKIGTKGGDTLYKVLKKHPPMNIILMLAGRVEPKDILEVTERGVNEHIKSYEYVLDQGEDLVKQWLEVVDIMRELKAGKVLEEDAKVLSGEVKMPDAKTTKTIDLLLEDASMPTLKEIVKTANRTAKIASDMEEMKAAFEKNEGKLRSEIEEMRVTVKEAMEKAAYNVAQEIHMEATDEIPEGNMTTRKASELFPDVDLKTDFEVPYFEWDGKHPDVPAIDAHYVWRPKILQRLLYSLVYDKKPFLTGDTGTGKTTAVQQLAARINFPFFRVSFDSDITRGDLTGKDKIKAVDGVTQSEYLMGILPKVLSGPGLVCFDEIDFVMPDVGYVMQSVTEGNGMRLLEEGGVEIKQHPMCRLFATGNTVGQGDDTGKYQGARAQSLAFLDRFGPWIEVDYLEKEERETLLRRHCPALTKEQRDTILRYTNEHIKAFKQDSVLQPISPRGMLSIGEATQVFGDVREAIEMNVIDRASSIDRPALIGIVDRVVDESVNL